MEARESIIVHVVNAMEKMSQRYAERAKEQGAEHGWPGLTEIMTMSDTGVDLIRAGDEAYRSADFMDTLAKEPDGLPPLRSIGKSLIVGGHLQMAVVALWAMHLALKSTSDSEIDEMASKLSFRSVGSGDSEGLVSHAIESMLAEVPEAQEEGEG